MRDSIVKRLHALEKERTIKILYACESGSRAWGFASPNSDWDVRFIYAHPLDWYLSLEERSDNIDLGVDAQELDFSGWELRKTLRLLGTSNASPFEWLQSPIVYHDPVGFRAQLWSLAQAYFKPKTTAFHYYGLAQNSLKRGMKNGQMDLKKYFYVLRPLLALRWIVHHQTPPPMEFGPLLETLKPEKELYTAIHRLVRQKKAANEGDFIAPVPLIQSFIKQALLDYKQAAQDLPSPSNSYRALDEFFIPLIQTTQC